MAIDPHPGHNDGSRHTGGAGTLMRPGGVRASRCDAELGLDTFAVSRYSSGALDSCNSRWSQLDSCGHDSACYNPCAA